jgi:uncharacterized protein with GYD domain
MPTSIAMLKWTSQGFQSVKQSPSRLDAESKGSKISGRKDEGLLHGYGPLRYGRCN